MITGLGGLLLPCSPELAALPGGLSSPIKLLIVIFRSEGFLFNGELKCSLGVVSYPELFAGDHLILSWHISEFGCSLDLLMILTCH